jgi:hypothetical protein
MEPMGRKVFREFKACRAFLVPKESKVPKGNLYKAFKDCRDYRVHLV